MVQANAFFQASLHHARSWKIKSGELEKELSTTKGKLAAANRAIKEKDDLFAKTHAELIAARSSREDIIDTYMDSEEYAAIMDQHDAMMPPYSMQKGGRLLWRQWLLGIRG